MTGKSPGGVKSVYQWYNFLTNLKDIERKIMPQTRTYCPRCRQPVTADINQLFDVNADPQAKQRILSGSFNMIHCPNCGYEGNLATPIVYHDPEKELLLTFFPPDLGLPVNEQERLVGPLIQQVVNKLPNEKRKAYLLRPQSMLTMQTMIERILEGEGITKEMLQAQQQRLNLIQRLLAAPENSRAEIARQEDPLIDENFFGMLSRLVETAIAGNDEQSARQLMALQQQLLNTTTVGKRLNAQVQETQAAAKSLQEASQKGLTREKLLDLLIEAPNEARLSALVGMARGGLDYQFFQLLSDRIDKAKGDDRQKLTDLRERLVQMTQEIDQEMQAQVGATRELLDKILQSSDIEKATVEALPAVSDLFIEVLRNEMEQARRKNDQNRLDKLQQVVEVLQKASSPPPEYALIEELISAKDDAERQKILESHKDEVTPQFIDMFNNLLSQSQAGNGPEQDKELGEQLQAAYRSALRFSMQQNLKK